MQSFLFYSIYCIHFYRVYICLVTRWGDMYSVETGSFCSHGEICFTFAMVVLVLSFPSWIRLIDIASVGAICVQMMVRVRIGEFKVNREILVAATTSTLVSPATSPPVLLLSASLRIIIRGVIWWDHFLLLCIGLFMLRDPVRLVWAILVLLC